MNDTKAKKERIEKEKGGRTILIPSRKILSNLRKVSTTLVVAITIEPQKVYFLVGMFQ